MADGNAAAIAASQGHKPVSDYERVLLLFCSQVPPRLVARSPLRGENDYETAARIAGKYWELCAHPVSGITEVWQAMHRLLRIDTRRFEPGQDEERFSDSLSHFAQEFLRWTDYETSDMLECYTEFGTSCADKGLPLLINACLSLQLLVQHKHSALVKRMDNPRDFLDLLFDLLKSMSPGLQICGARLLGTYLQSMERHCKPDLSASEMYDVMKAFLRLVKPACATAHGEYCRLFEMYNLSEFALCSLGSSSFMQLDYTHAVLIQQNVVDGMLDLILDTHMETWKNQQHNYSAGLPSVCNVMRQMNEMIMMGSMADAAVSHALARDVLTGDVALYGPDLLRHMVGVFDYIVQDTNTSRPANLSAYVPVCSTIISMLEEGNDSGFSSADDNERGSEWLRLQMALEAWREHPSDSWQRRRLMLCAAAGIMRRQDFLYGSLQTYRIFFTVMDALSGGSDSAAAEEDPFDLELCDGRGKPPGWQLSYIEAVAALRKQLLTRTGTADASGAADSGTDSRLYDLLLQCETLEKAKLVQENEALKGKAKELADALAELRIDAAATADVLRLEKQALRHEVERLSAESDALRAQLAAPVSSTTVPDSVDSMQVACGDVGALILAGDARGAAISHADAEAHIRNLQARERQFSGEWRKMLCGTLHWLGASLYSSPLHFVMELIQNAEDCSYPEDAAPELRLIVGPGYLLVSSNELGFRVKDVNSICSLCTSTKTAGQSIGHKGVGFKSVFSVTSRPTVLSGRWSFCFDVAQYDQGHHDAIAMVTPHWVNRSDLPVEVCSRLQVADDGVVKGTHLYLPLKPELPVKGGMENFSKELRQTLNPLTILAMRKLQRLVVEDGEGGPKADISRTGVRDLPIDSRLSSACDADGVVTISGIRLLDLSSCELAITFSQDEDENQHPQGGSQFHVFAARAHPQKQPVTIAFPITLASTEDLHNFASPVFAGLPVCDLGFKFMLNADWQLATNRAAVLENMDNADLRDAAAAVFVAACVSNESIRQNLELYIPKTSPEMPPWWCCFVESVHAGLRASLHLILDSSLPLFLPSEEIDELRIGNDVMEDLAAVKIIPYKNAGWMSGLAVCPQVSITHVLKCFKRAIALTSASKKHPFLGWAEMQPRQWWTQFFTLVEEQHRTQPGGAGHSDASDTVDDASIDVLKLPLFLQCTEGNLPRTVCPTDAKLFCLPAHCQPDTDEWKSFKPWRRNIVVLGHGSEAERNVLVHVCGVEMVTPTRLLDAILRLHASTPARKMDLQEVWEDLLYALKHADVLRQLQGYPVAGRPGHIQLPVRLGKEITFRPATAVVLPTVMGVRLFHEKSLAELLHRQPVFHVDDARLDRKELFQLEALLLSMGCRYPCYSPELKRHTTGEVLPPFASMDEGMAHTASHLMWDHIEESGLARRVRRMPMVAVDSGERVGEQQQVPVEMVAVRQFFHGVLPCVEVPKHTEALASKLGVQLHQDVSGCLRVLKELSRIKHPQPDTECLKWMRFLQSELSKPEATSAELIEFARCPLLHLQSGENRAIDLSTISKTAKIWLLELVRAHALGLERVCPANVYISKDEHEHETDRNLRVVVSALLGRRIVTADCNSEFWDVKDLLIRFGCRSTIGAGDLCCALDEAAWRAADEAAKQCNSGIPPPYHNDILAVLGPAAEQQMQVVDATGSALHQRMQSALDGYRTVLRPLFDLLTPSPESQKQADPMVLHNGNETGDKEMEGSPGHSIHHGTAALGPRTPLKANDSKQHMYRGSKIPTGDSLHPAQHHSQKPSPALPTDNNQKGMENGSSAQGVVHSTPAGCTGSTGNNRKQGGPRSKPRGRTIHLDEFLNGGSTQAERSKQAAKEAASRQAREAPATPQAHSAGSVGKTHSPREAGKKKKLGWHQHQNPALQTFPDDEETRTTGQQAEEYVAWYLEDLLGSGFSICKNWRSSNRHCSRPELGRENIDDSLGYDFEVDDPNGLLQPSNSSRAPAKRCYIEVKGTSGEWHKGSIFMSANEYATAQRFVRRAGAAASSERAHSSDVYLLMVVEGAGIYSSRPQISHVINMCDEGNGVQLLEDRYKIILPTGHQQ